jgi:hypothetical protein
MKNKLVNHIVNATTKHKKMVIIITIILCILSIVAMVFLLKLDTSFKGLAGDGIPEVEQFETVIEEFSASGTTTVTLEPKEEEQKQVLEYDKQIDELVFDALDENGKQTVINYLKEYYRIKALKHLTDKQTIQVAIVMFKQFDKDKRVSILNQFESLNARDKQTINELINNLNEENQRTIYRKLTKLNDKEIETLIKYADDASGETKDLVIKKILGYISVYEEEGLIDELNSLSQEKKEEIKTKINDINSKKIKITRKFKEKARDFADGLKSEYQKSSNQNGEFGEMVKGIIYSDEISLSKDDLMYMLMVIPQGNVDDSFYAMQFATVVENELNKLEEDYPNLIVKTTGFAVLILDEQLAVMEGFWLMSLITIVAIVLIFLVGLRRIVFPIMALIPLFVGIILMFGIFSIIVQTLNLFSVMMPILLFGLGIDYAIHFGTRYGEARLELGKEAPQEEVLKSTFNTVGSGLIVGSTTSAFAFLALLNSSIIGLAHSGIIAALGVATAFLAEMYLLPILVTWRERKYIEKGKEEGFLKGKKFISMGRLANSHAGAIIAVILILATLSSIYFIPKIKIETDAMEMEPEGLESVELSKELAEKYNMSDMQSYFIVKGHNNLIEFRKELNRKDDKGNPVYLTVNTRLIMDARNAILSFKEIGWEVGNMETLDKYVEKLANKSGFFGGASNKDIAKLNEFIVRNYVNWEEEEFLVMVPPSGYVWNKDFLDQHIKDIDRLEAETGINGAGMVEIWGFIIDHLMGDLLRSSLTAFGIVFILLLIVSRSIKGTIICSLNLLFSVLITLSIMALIGIKMNIVTVISFPLIIGLGIDDSVHIFFRTVKEEGLDIIEGVSSTGKAILMTTLTTVAAFGSFGLSIHRGMAQMGIVTSIGLIVAYLCSVFVMPTMIKLFYRKQIKK